MNYLSLYGIVAGFATELERGKDRLVYISWLGLIFTDAIDGEVI